MGETTNQIEAHLDKTRADLGQNLHELENKFKSAVDWKQQFQKKPSGLLAVAFGGGLVLSMMVGRRRARQSSLMETPSRHSNGNSGALWGNMKAALVGIASARFTELVEDLIPSFRSQLHRDGGFARPHNDRQSLVDKSVLDKKDQYD